jgi:hypothetical protein
MVALSQLENGAARRKKVRNPSISIAVGIGFLTLFGAMFSPSPLVILATGAVVLVAVLCLWRSNEPPILLVPIILQLIAISIKPITTAFTGTPLQEMSDFDNNLEPAVLFALASVAALVLGVRLTAFSGPPTAGSSSQAWSFKRILAYSLLAIVTGHALQVFSNSFSEARQILLALSGIKWAGFFVLAYTTLSMQRGRGWLAGLLLFELILGMTGFFAEFQEVIFVTTAAAISARVTVRARDVLVFTIGAALVVLLGIFWSSIKEDYRNFLNGGTGAQVALQPLDQRLNFLANAVAEFDNEKFMVGAEQLRKRLSYIDYLAAAMERVPAYVPYEGGARVGKVIWHVLTPRVLFPDKPEVENDTEVTAHYTGLGNAMLVDQSITSISMGYLAELYVDFGISGALLAVFLLGLVYGRGYRAVRDCNRLPAFLNYGFCMVVALPIGSFGTALIKLVGGTIMVFAAVFLLQRFVPQFSRNVRHEVGNRNLRPGPKA